jgi:hypothetical protein
LRLLGVPRRLVVFWEWFEGGRNVRMSVKVGAKVIDESSLGLVSPKKI